MLLVQHLVIHIFQVDDTPVIIEEGNYTVNPGQLSRGAITSSTSFTESLQTQMQASVADLSFSYDVIKGKTTIQSISSTQVSFNKDINGDLDLDVPLPLKLGWLLGFRAGTYELTADNSYSITSEGIYSITGPKYVYICINDYTNAANNHYVAAFSSSVLSPHIIARVNYQNLVENNGVYNYCEDDEFNDSHTRSREYFGPVDINRLHFQILDEYGRVLDLNNMDWSCALTFDVMYD